jgi:C4-dicarboxylate transporter, DctQ subunit
MEKTGLESFYRILKKVNTFCAFVAGLVLLFITLSIFVDVVLRYFFSSPTIWVTEVSTYLFLYLIFLGTAYALQQGTHIRVTFLLEHLNLKLKRIISIFTSLFAMIFTAVLLWQSSLMTWSAFSQHWTSPTMLNAPMTYVYVAMVIGSLMLLVTFFCQMVLEFKSGGKAGEKA